MSILLKQKFQIRQLNEMFGRELGRTVEQNPRYAWLWSEDLTRAKRVITRTNEGYCLSYRQFAPNPEYPDILTTEPLFEVEKLCPHIHNCYILCVWMESPSYEEWYRLWGDSLEWPKGGEYFPVTGPQRGECRLQEHEKPTEHHTWTVIGWVKEDRARSQATLLSIYEMAAKERELGNQKRIQGELSNLLPAYDDGSPSGPNWFLGTTKVDSRIADAAATEKLFGAAFKTNVAGAKFFGAALGVNVKGPGFEESWVEKGKEIGSQSS